MDAGGDKMLDIRIADAKVLEIGSEKGCGGVLDIGY